MANAIIELILPPDMGNATSSLDNTTEAVLIHRTDYANRLVLALLEATLTVVIVIGNLLVIFGIRRARNLWTVTNFFIVELAVADLLVGLSLPYEAYTFLSDLTYHNIYACIARYDVLLVTQV